MLAMENASASFPDASQRNSVPSSAWMFFFLIRTILNVSHHPINKLRRHMKTTWLCGRIKSQTPLKRGNKHAVADSWARMMERLATTSWLQGGWAVNTRLLSEGAGVAGDGRERLFDCNAKKLANVPEGLRQTFDCFFFFFKLKYSIMLMLSLAIQQRLKSH